MSFIKELKRRNVFRVGIAYIIGGWLLLQLTEVLSELLKLPEEIGPIVVAIVAIGLPIALFFAWAFELTPEGVKRESDVDRSQSITQQTGQKLNYAVIGMLVLAAGYFFWESRYQNDNAVPSETTAGLEQATQAEAEVAPERIAEKSTTALGRQSIAVLPFDNRSRNVDDEYFTEGIHDDLLTNLARIGSLKVISRTSVNQYKGTEKTIPEIALELGVATVMEGAVQRSGDTVRINVQLIDAKTDEHLWAEIFDRELTAQNLFAIQSEISQKIADALEATLSPEEEQRINEFPTQSLEAYNAYLRGRQLLPQRNSKDLNQAKEAFELAVELDPEFALAWVGIAESAALLVTHGSLNRDTHQEITASAITRALAINPNLGEAYTSKGGLHDELNQRDQAEAAYKRAIELSPNYATTYHWYSILISNTNDRLQESLELINKAAQLDPLAPIIQQNIAVMYGRMGRYAEAESVYQQIIAANPEFSPAMVSVSALLYMRGLGQLDEAVIWAQKSSKVDPGKIGSLAVEYNLWLRLDDDTRAQAVYQQMEDLAPGHPWMVASKARMDIKHHRVAAAKEQALFLAQSFSNPDSQWQAGEIFARSGDYDQAREYLLRVEPRFLDRRQWSGVMNEGTDDACLVGLTLMRTGDEVLGQELLSFAANYWEQTLPLYIQHADRFPSYECYAYLGDVEKSLAALEISLTHKHVLRHWVFIASNPEFRLIHEDPRFKAMDQSARAELARQRENLARMEVEAGP